MAKFTIRGNEAQTTGELPAVGKPAPDFKLIAQDLSEKSLADFKGKKKILNIFPSVDTSVCAASVRKFYQMMEKHPETPVLNISMDLPFAQGRFCGTEGLNNVITLSAFRSTFPKDYGVMIAEGPLKGICSRAVIIVDENDKVIYSQLAPELSQEPNYESALASIF